MPVFSAIYGAILLRCDLKCHITLSNLKWRGSGSPSILLSRQLLGPFWGSFRHRKAHTGRLGIRFMRGVVQLVRTPACHAGGRGFESRRFRQHFKLRVTKAVSALRQRIVPDRLEIALFGNRGTALTPARSRVSGQTIAHTRWFTILASPHSLLSKDLWIGSA